MAAAVAATVWLGPQGLPWLALPIALADGALVSWLLGRIAYRRLERRLPEMFTRTRYGKAIAAQAVPESGTACWTSWNAAHWPATRRPNPPAPDSSR